MHRENCSSASPHQSECWHPLQYLAWLSTFQSLQQTIHPGLQDTVQSPTKILHWANSSSLPLGSKEARFGRILNQLQSSVDDLLVNASAALWAAKLAASAA